MITALSNRGKEWCEFSGAVGKHVEEYTVPRYGDAPDDQVAKWSDHDLVVQIQKLAGRLEATQRSEDKTLDLKKIAHYAGMLWSRRTEPRQ